MNTKAIETATVEAPTTEGDSAPVDTPTIEPADAPAEGEQGDVFPREVVEKLRKESASYRDRARTAEDRLAAMQRQSVDRHIAASGMRPAAVWATAQLGDLLADDGTVDTTKVDRAMADARQSLGIARRTAPYPGKGELNSGATGVKDHTPAPGFAKAFGPRPK